MQKYVAGEFTFKSTTKANHFLNTEATALLTLPDGTTERLGLFHEGPDSFTMRLAPWMEGEWSYVIESNDRLLDGQSGRFSVLDSDEAGGIVRDGYGYARENGEDFYPLGWTQWALNLDHPNNGKTYAATQANLNQRQDDGFNYFHTVLAHVGNDGRTVSGNTAGTPWESGPDYGRIRLGYFDEVDSRIEWATEEGWHVGLVIGWSHTLDFMTAAEREAYVKMAVARYGAYDVSFVLAGEWSERLSEAEVDQIARWIEEVDGHDRMLALHPTGNSTVQAFADKGWMDVADYAQRPAGGIHADMLDARNAALKPYWVSEMIYPTIGVEADEEAHLLGAWEATFAGAHVVVGSRSDFWNASPGSSPNFSNWSDANEFAETAGHVGRFVTTVPTGHAAIADDWMTMAPADARVRGSANALHAMQNGAAATWVLIDDATSDISVDVRGGAPYDVALFNADTGTWSTLGLRSGATIRLDLGTDIRPDTRYALKLTRDEPSSPPLLPPPSPPDSPPPAPPPSPPPTAGDPSLPTIDGRSITGTNAGNFLVGTNANDRIDGMGGSDHLVGDSGRDILTGGAGWDTFSGTAGEFNGDRITDFGRGGDRIVVKNTSFDASAINPIFHDTTTTLEIDSSGDGRADFSLVLDGIFTGSFNAFGSSSFKGATEIRYDGPILDTVPGSPPASPPPPPPPPPPPAPPPPATPDDPAPPTIDGRSITGTSGNDHLVGTSRNDRIDGGGGSDFIRGDGGQDILAGGAGWDRFSGTFAEFDGDWIVDFGRGVDRITVRDLFTAQDLSVARGASETLLSIDTNGDGKPETRFTLEGSYPGTFEVWTGATATDIHYDPSSVV